MRKLAVVPCGVFLFFAALSVGMALIEVVPNSTFLWWINIEMFPRFRTLFYLLEDYVSPNPVVLALMFGFLASTATLAGATLFERRYRRRIAYLTNHIAALAIGISLLTTRVAPVAVNDDGFVASSWALLRPLFSASNGLNLFMLSAALVSCAGCHWAVLKRQ